MNKARSKLLKLNEVLGAGKYLIATGVPLFIILIILSATPPFDSKFTIFNLFINDIIGIILLILGVIIYILSIYHIRRFVKEGQLYTEGIYSIVRHPLYSAIILLILPAIIILLRLIFLWLVIFVELVVFHFGIKKEEKELIEKFGEKYVEYMNRVKRIIPFIY
ncbi:MAG: isoprenylcysteine carboxylmethyltransferase family protein [Promethearchaeia archaeon]